MMRNRLQPLRDGELTEDETLKIPVVSERIEHSDRSEYDGSIKGEGQPASVLEQNINASKNPVNEQSPHTPLPGEFLPHIQGFHSVALDIPIEGPTEPRIKNAVHLHHLIEQQPTLVMTSVQEVEPPRHAQPALAVAVHPVESELEKAALSQLETERIQIPLEVADGLELTPESIPPRRRSILRAVQAGIYRCMLVAGTLLVMWLLFLIQNTWQLNPPRGDIWQQITRWSEIVWMIPAPIAFIFWIGWFIYAQHVRPDPSPIPVPQLVLRDRQRREIQTRPICLVFRLVTRGDNEDILRESVNAVHRAFERYPYEAPYRIEVVAECALDLEDISKGRTHVIIVPGTYQTAHASRFKARAMTYLQEQTTPAPEDWHIYLDEESLVDEVFVAGVYHFVVQSQRLMQRPEQQRPKGVIGQGTIIYQGGNWFYRAADAMRTGDDLGRFRLQYGIGAPIFGMHGSFIVVRGIDDARLPFDVGPRNSIAEDAAWALRAWHKGYRFSWVDGYLYEQPPQTMHDFIKQRSRWLIGIRGVLSDKTLPLRYRFWLGVFTYSWHLSLFPMLIAIIALFTHTTAFLWVQLPANFAWAVFFLAYFQGMDKQVQRTARFMSGKRPAWILTFFKRIITYPLSLGIFWYTLIESISIFYSCIKPNQGFFVIRKPNLQQTRREGPQ